MRIGLIVGPGYPVPPPNYGGIERVVDTLARGLAAAGHDVLLAGPSDSSCPVPLAAGMWESDSTRRGSIPTELSHSIRAYGAMGQMDVIHDHTLIGPLCAHRPGPIPTVATIHGRLVPEVAEIYRAMSSNTSIIAISHDQIRHVADLHVARVIHHGMDFSSVPVGTGRGGYACFLGRMCPDKGVMEAVLIAHSAGLPLRIATKMREPAELEYFHEVVNPVLGPDDELVGEIGDYEKFELLGNAVALLSPLQWPEPFGLVMIEALATGTPVISTASGGGTGDRGQRHHRIPGTPPRTRPTPATGGQPGPRSVQGNRRGTVQCTKNGCRPSGPLPRDPRPGLCSGSNASSSQCPHLR